MARVAFTDYSGLGRFKGSGLTTTFLFVETPCSLNPETLQIHPTAVVLNGIPIEFWATLKQENGGWLADVGVVDGPSIEPTGSFAKFYFSQTLDVASLLHASPFEVLPRGDTESFHSRFQRVSTAAVISALDFERCTKLAFLLYTFEPVMLRSIGWYRRGLSSSDVQQRFLGLWNSLEIVASKFFKPPPRSGATGQAATTKLKLQALLERKSGFQFFQPGTSEMKEWIDANYNVRVDIAHGLGSTDFETFEKTERMLPAMRRIATATLQAFLTSRLKENTDMGNAINAADQRASKGKRPIETEGWPF